MNKLGKYITYDDKFFENALSFLMRYRLLEIDLNCTLLENLETNKQLENLFSNYLSLGVINNPEIIIPRKMEIKEIVAIANEILISMLPSFEKDIFGYDDLIYIHEELSFSEACYNYHLSDDNIVIHSSIDISANFNEAAVGTINHEKIHALVFEKINLVQFPGIYMELLSIFFQKVSSYLLESKINSKQTTIIDNIIHTIDNKSHINALDNLKEINIANETLNSRFVYQFLNLKANDYLLSDWYSELLFIYYLVDPQKMIKKINQVFNRQITIQELLDYYQISLKSKELYPHINDKLDETKKYIIKP